MQMLRAEMRKELQPVREALEDDYVKYITAAEKGQGIASDTMGGGGRPDDMDSIGQPSSKRAKYYHTSSSAALDEDLLFGRLSGTDANETGRPLHDSILRFIDNDNSTHKGVQRGTQFGGGEGRSAYGHEKEDMMDVGGSPRFSASYLASLTKPETVVEAIISKELKDYYEEKGSVDKEKPDAVGAWWAARVRKFPLLAYIAAKHLVVPATSAGVERSFSKAGLINTKVRNRLSPENLELLVQVKLNWNDVFYTLTKNKVKGANEVTRDEDIPGGFTYDFLTVHEQSESAGAPGQADDTDTRGVFFDNLEEDLMEEDDGEEQAMDNDDD